MDIDFVVTWVDGNDPAWLAEREKYLTNVQNGRKKYFRDTETIRYFFRSIDKFAPWYRKVFFITWGHVPSWLDTKNPKLVIVRHDEFIPKEYLPTFCSNTIENNLWRIQDLSEHFVYFNDDMLLGRPVGKEHFFVKEVPCDYIEFEPAMADENNDVYYHIVYNDLWMIRRNFDLWKCFSHHMSKYINIQYSFKQNVKNFLMLTYRIFPGMNIHHLSSPILKSTMKVVWDSDPKYFDMISHNRFRSPMNISHSAVRFWQLASGKFHVISKKKKGKYFVLTDDMQEFAEAIFTEKYCELCINDSFDDIDFENCKQKLLSILDQKFCQKSSFEL